MNSSRETLPPTGFFVARLVAFQAIPIIVIGLCWMVVNSWQLIPGLLAKAFFDTLEGRAPVGLTLESIVVLVIAAGFARSGFLYAAVRAGFMTTLKVQTLVQRNILARIFELPGAKALPGNVGEVISTLRDDVEFMDILTGWVFDAFAATIFAGGGIAILLWIDTRVTLWVFIPIVVILGFSHAARARLERAREQSRDATARVTGLIGEIFGAVQAIKVAGAANDVVAHLRRLGNERQQAMLRDQLQVLSLDAIFANTTNLGAGLTLLVATSQMRSGEFTVGEFALFATYLMQVAEYTSFLAYLVTSYRQSGVAVRRAVAVLQGAPAKQLVAHHPVYLSGPMPPLEAMAKGEGDRLETFEVVDLTLRHPESAHGIENISFTLKRGSFIVITGRIGSGKTTLLRAILGLLQPQAGEIRWNGRTIADPACFLVPPRTAYTAQVPTLISGTLQENILLGRPADHQLVHAVHCAVLERDVAGFPNGLETVIGTKGMKLSGGQLQRTAAARMFVREPELLIVDDLSSALDVETEQTLWQRVFELGTTCLVVSHRRTVLERADQILMLEAGHITARGGLEELLNMSAAMRQLYASEPNNHA